jgi:hypothetical protein
MTRIRPETTRPTITEQQHISPLAVTVKRAAELSGLGLTSIWSFLKNGRLEAVRLPGIRRTLINYASLAHLLAPPSALSTPRRRRGRPRKTAAPQNCGSDR